MTTDKFSYTLADVQVLAAFISHVRDAPIIYANQHIITYILQQGIAKFGETAKQAAI